MLLALVTVQEPDIMVTIAKFLKSVQKVQMAYPVRMAASQLATLDTVVAIALQPNLRAQTV